MRIRYAYKLTGEDGSTSFVVLNHIKSEDEVKAQFEDKGCTQATFHARVRTGFRLDENGELVETGLVGSRSNKEAVVDEAPAPKAKKSSKKSKK